MSKSSDSPKSLSEAIEKLESASTSKANDLGQMLEGDLAKIKTALDELKPHLENLTENIQGQAKKAKGEVESKIKESPWLAIGVVGLIAFVIGWLLGHKRND